MCNKWIALPCLSDVDSLVDDLIARKARYAEPPSVIISSIPIHDVGRAMRIGDTIIIEVAIDELSANRYVYQIHN